MDNPAVRPAPPKSLLMAALGGTAAAALVAASPCQALVRDLSGRVLGGAQDERVLVTAWHNDLRAGVVEPLAEGFAGADRTFTLRAVPWFEKQQWGSHSVVVVARQKQRVGLRTLRGDAAATDRVQIELLPAVDVRGVLRAQGTGKPIVGAWVWPRIFGWGTMAKEPIWLTSPLLPWRAVTDADGRFVLKALPPIVPMLLLAGSEEFARTSIEVKDCGQPVVAELPLGGKVRGTVRMPDGKPAARVRVRATGRGAGYGETTSGEAGTFCLGGLAADVYKVFAEAPDLTVIAVPDLDVTPGVVLENQVVQLVHGGFIVGRIVDKATGAPFVPGPQTDVAMYGPARGDGGSCEVVPVLADGTFRIRAPGGRNRIYLRGARGYSEPSEFVEVVEGQETKVEWLVEERKRIGK
jgi:hypothetical protein